MLNIIYFTKASIMANLIRFWSCVFFNKSTLVKFTNFCLFVCIKKVLISAETAVQTEL